MATDIAPLQPLTLASFQTWGIQRELVVSVAAAKLNGLILNAMKDAKKFL